MIGSFLCYGIFQCLASTFLTNYSKINSFDCNLNSIYYIEVVRVIVAVGDTLVATRLTIYAWFFTLQSKGKFVIL